ncbi:copper chaperone PCu(A)C [Actinomadura darangshiensis]|uniref:copper chaperone PCu(A)C n=1 Tax=Actinomadura darangshiensis TaxID=705336 RepID=UPI001A9FFE8C|nr:copper chaperone PCu(A)C [Actinomadura darangshiensis]
MRRLAAGSAVLVLVTAGAACASHNAGRDGPRLAVTGAYVPEPPMADMAAGYFTVVNTGTGADRLTGVTSDIATDVSLHTTTANGAMSAVKAMAVPAHGRLVLRTGGHHLMLMGLRRKPKTGDTVTFTLRFATSSPITVRAPVRPATYRPER